MGGIVFIIFIFILLNVIKSASKNAAKSVVKKGYKAAVKKSTPRNPWNADDAANAADKAEWTKMQAQYKAANALRNSKFAKNTARKRRDLQDANASRRRDPNDKNRNRVHSWGEREKSGGLSLSNLLVVLSLGLMVLYGLSA